MGWAGVKNGALLKLAAADVDCFLTVDRNLQFQQNASSLPMAVIVVHALGNAFGLAPCLTAVFSRSFIFGTSDSIHSA